MRVLRHTYATWLRLYAGADLKALLDTGAWRDLKSVARYTHAVPSYLSRAAAMQAGRLFIQRKEGEALGRRGRPRRK